MGLKGSSRTSLMSRGSEQRHLTSERASKKSSTGSHVIRRIGKPMTPTNGNLSVERFSQKPPRNSDLNNVSYREDKRITDLTMDSRVHFEELILQK